MLRCDCGTLVAAAIRVKGEAGRVRSGTCEASARTRKQVLHHYTVISGEAARVFSAMSSRETLWFG